MNTATKALAVGALVAAAALHAAPAAAKTGVAVEGTTVTLTMPIDMLGLPEDGGRVIDMETGEQHVYSDWLEQGGEQLWNEAFARLPYGGCLTFQLDIEIHPVASSRTSGPARGHHGINFDPHTPMVAHVYDKVGTADHNADTPFAFETSLTGDFGLIDQEIFAHEVGHLFGLGDDYLRGEDGDAIDGVVEGREEGTLMHGSQTPIITQAIVDRIGALVDQVRDLPDCWHGTMEAAGSYGVDFPEGSLSCDYAWSAEFAFTVDGSDRAAGTGSATLDPDSSCIEVLAPVGYPGTTPISFQVEGTEGDDGFALVFTREMVPSFPYHILTVNPETISLAKSDPCTAAASIEQDTEDFQRQAGVDGPGWDVHSTTHIELRCSTGERPD